MAKEAKKIKNPNYMGKKKKKKISWYKIKRYLYFAVVAFIVIYYLLQNVQWGDNGDVQDGSQPAATTALQGLTDIVPPEPGVDINYQLAGSSHSNETDAGGNKTDRSDWLTSVKSYKDVLPRGFILDMVPEYHGAKYAVVNANIPFFTDGEKNLAHQGYFEYYGNLDSLGRCTVAFDCLGRETMPASGEKRGDISSIHPSGWKQARYDCVDSETVLTRAHLAGYILSAENANEKNLVTGTRYMNSDSMLKFEDDVRYYIYRHKGSHVLYRVTPVYNGNELMPRGLLMEAYSVEDFGTGLQYCVYIYNIQPGVRFNYSSGRSEYTGIFYDTDSECVITDGISLASYVLDKSTNTIHNPQCSHFAELKLTDIATFWGDKDMQSSWSRFGYKLCNECMK